MGEDKETFLELMSYVFKERRLFNANLSKSIWEKFIEIAHENISMFIKSVSVDFLAFYLGKLTTIPYVPKEHVALWTKFILSPSSNKSHLLKILSAMKLRQAPEILPILILSTKENVRGEALDILWDYLKSNKIAASKYRVSYSYFLKKQISSKFYDFHQISQKQKICTANIIMLAHAGDLVELIGSVIRDQTLSDDPKQTETKKIFVTLLGKLGKKNSAIVDLLRSVVKESNIENEVRESAAKAVLTACGG